MREDYFTLPLPSQIPLVRVNAVSALELLQEPVPDCPITIALLSLLAKDSSPDVRRRVLAIIGISNTTLPGKCLAPGLYLSSLVVGGWGSNIPLAVGAWGSNAPLAVGGWGSNVPLVVIMISELYYYHCCWHLCCVVHLLYPAAVIGRTRDVKEMIRREAFLWLSEKCTIRHLTINQRIQVSGNTHSYMLQLLVESFKFVRITSSPFFLWTVQGLFVIHPCCSCFVTASMTPVSWCRRRVSMGCCGAGVSPSTETSWPSSRASTWRAPQMCVGGGGGVLCLKCSTRVLLAGWRACSQEAL